VIPQGSTSTPAGDEPSLTPLQRRVWFLSGLGVLLDGFDLFIIGVALPLITMQFALSDFDKGMVGAAAVLGAVVGAAVMGHLADHFGRRLLFMIDLLLFVVFAVLSGFAWDLWSLLAFRFLLGFAVGADYPIASSYLAEFMPSSVRGRWMVGAFSFQAIGILLGASLGVLILLSGADQELAWRLMLAAGAIPALIIVFLRRSIPESPEWEHATKTEEQKPGIRALFAPGLRRRTILAVVPWFLMDIMLYGVGIFTPTILAMLSIGGGDDIMAKDVATTAGTAALDVFLVIGFIIAILLVERVGRMSLQIAGFLGTTVGLLLLASGSLGTQSNAVILIGFAVFNLMVNTGPNSTTFLVAAEVFPTHLRATGAGLAASAAKLGAVVGIVMLPVMLGSIGLAATMYIIAGASALGMIVTTVFRFETAGRDLREINTLPYPVPSPREHAGADT
jgi:MFS family permease